jgi:hypothetical protein
LQVAIQSSDRDSYHLPKFFQGDDHVNSGLRPRAARSSSSNDRGCYNVLSDSARPYALKLRYEVKGL